MTDGQNRQKDLMTLRGHQNYKYCSEHKKIVKEIFWDQIWEAAPFGNKHFGEGDFFFFQEK